MKERYKIEVLDKKTGKVQRFHVHRVNVRAENSWMPTGVGMSVNVGQLITLEFANPRTTKTKRKK